mmetsp:Transcript_73569/g.228790  ORF Transcript_73569/g.228790 Transcript_73569/m.228790 type:complete len:243 (-) Transcript_73569:328-1056(-)
MVFIKDQKQMPKRVMVKAVTCCFVTVSPKQKQEKSTMKMSFATPTSTKPTAEHSLMTAATQTFSRKARRALHRSRGHQTCRSCSVPGCQWTKFARTSTTKQVGATNMVYVRGSSFFPLSTNSPMIILQHSASWETPWNTKPGSEKRRSPLMARLEPAITQTITSIRMRFICCRPNRQEMRKTTMTLPSFMNCRKVTLEYMYAWFEPNSMTAKHPPIGRNHFIKPKRFPFVSSIAGNMLGARV